MLQDIISTLTGSRKIKVNVTEAKVGIKLFRYTSIIIPAMMLAT